MKKIFILGITLYKIRVNNIYPAYVRIKRKYTYTWWSLLLCLIKIN